MERIYAWFTDFAAPDTLATFGREVIAALGDESVAGGSP